VNYFVPFESDLLYYPEELADVLVHEEKAE
jgi:hypothetical protein